MSDTRREPQLEAIHELLRERRFDELSAQQWMLVFKSLIIEDAEHYHQSKSRGLPMYLSGGLGYKFDVASEISPGRGGEITGAAEFFENLDPETKRLAHQGLRLVIATASAGHLGRFWTEKARLMERMIEWETGSGAKNIDAMLTWARNNRPDLIPYLERMLESEKKHEDAGRAALLLLTVGFEAGRQFQKENPTAPMDPSAY